MEKASMQALPPRQQQYITAAPSQTMITAPEQKKAKDKWWKDKRLDGAPTDKRYDAFLQAYEGMPTCDVNRDFGRRG
ncbi:hypothetical protein E4U26_003619 [Claviceps purpurea]|nr:hypothetical protein E4U26_003619 [Claviceps purpurea]